MYRVTIEVEIYMVTDENSVLHTIVLQRIGMVYDRT